MLLEGKVFFLQRFQYKSSYHKISLFNARGHKLGHFDIYDMLLPFLTFFKL